MKKEPAHNDLSNAPSGFLKRVKKDQVFEVPQGYFQEAKLTLEILSREHLKTENEKAIMPFRHQIIQSAAILALMALCFGFLMLPKSQPDSKDPLDFTAIKTSELVSYTFEEMDFEEEELLDLMEEEEFASLNWSESISEKELNEYIEEENWGDLDEYYFESL